MATVVRNDERRDFSRVAFHCRAELALGGRMIPCELVDISLGGALVRVSTAPLRDEQECALMVYLDEGASMITMHGAIAHHALHTIGLICKQIDVDSLAHLRRLVELNLGDEQMLRREFVALVARHHP